MTLTSIALESWSARSSRSPRVSRHSRTSQSAIADAGVSPSASVRASNSHAFRWTRPRPSKRFSPTASSRHSAVLTMAWAVHGRKACSEAFRGICGTALPLPAPRQFPCAVYECTESNAGARFTFAYHLRCGTQSAVRNIVFFKYVRSAMDLDQMVGRGTRIDPPSGKLMFPVYDYTDATRLFGEECLGEPPRLRKAREGPEPLPPLPVPAARWRPA